MSEWCDQFIGRIDDVYDRHLDQRGKLGLDRQGHSAIDHHARYGDLKMVRFYSNKVAPSNANSLSTVQTAQSRLSLDMDSAGQPEQSADVSNTSQPDNAEPSAGESAGGVDTEDVRQSNTHNEQQEFKHSDCEDIEEFNLV